MVRFFTQMKKGELTLFLEKTVPQQGSGGLTVTRRAVDADTKEHPEAFAAFMGTPYVPEPAEYVEPQYAPPAIGHVELDPHPVPLVRKHRSLLRMGEEASGIAIPEEPNVIVSDLTFIPIEE